MIERETDFEKLLAEHGTTVEDLAKTKKLHPWEMRAVRDRNYGRLRLSSAVKIHHALGIDEKEVFQALFDDAMDGVGRHVSSAPEQ